MGTDDAGPDLLAAALEYASLGYAVYPIFEPAAEGVCSCGCSHPHCWERAKHPRVDWRRDATTDAATICDWWRLWPRAGVAINCPRSGVVVIDVDVDTSGRDRLPDLVRRFGPGVTETLTARTGSGGWHLHFRALDGGPPETLKGRLGPGIDVQATATMPPSLHRNLMPFTWVEGRGPRECPPAPLPEDVWQAIASPPSMAWRARQLPYSLADRAGLSMDARRRLRRVQRAMLAPVAGLKRGAR